MPEEKEEAEEGIKEKEKPRPFWERVHPFFLIAGGVLVYLALKSMFMTEEGGTNYLFLIIVVGIILYLLSKKEEPRMGILKPYEAEVKVEKEIARKINWGQLPNMTKWKISLVNNMLYKDGRGLHYLIGTIKSNPYSKTEYPLAKVIAKGDTKGFVTFTEGIRPFTGRDIQDIRDIAKLPEFLRLQKEHPILDKLWNR